MGKSALTKTACVITTALAATTLIGCEPATELTSHADEELLQEAHAIAPIDCAEYEAPTYIDGLRGAMLLTDTRTGQKWWVLRFNNGNNFSESDNYVVLPVDGTVSKG